MKILILRLSSLGDIVLTQPVTAVLRLKFPDARIDYLTKPQFKQIVESFKTVDNILLWKEKSEIIKEIRKERYDIVIDLHRKINTFLIKLFSGAKNKITYQKYHFHRKLLTWHLTKKDNETTVNLYLQVLRKIGIDSQDVLPDIFADRANKKTVESILKEKNVPQDKHLIALFPGALHETKRYPLENLEALLELIPDTLNCHFLLLGSKGEKHLTDKLYQSNSEIASDLCGEFNLTQLIYLMDNVEVIISNDSGPMHLAAALHKDQIALFGATHTSLGFAPQNPKAIIMQANLNCQPCSLHGDDKCPKGHFNCMKNLDASELYKHLRKMIEQNNSL